ncbi:11863_t:CDS:2 [Acaulospora morrowiae]|uniref:11863_t:CDS:1 n=1 Tax=Acaulospora morrowiae TaxID=94023 RepID=A0A9N9HGF3_9GLOM|nr:11863_t:CDS:2 [Acaulospora morrowiae]
MDRGTGDNNIDDDNSSLFNNASIPFRSRFFDDDDNPPFQPLETDTPFSSFPPPPPSPTQTQPRWMFRPSPQKYFTTKIKPHTKYLSEMCNRLGQFILIILTLCIFSLILRYQSVPDSKDFSEVDFDWKFNPATYLKPNEEFFGNYNVLLNGHIHTTYSDGKMTPEQVLKWSMAYGYNAIIVSDHNTIEGGLETQRIAREKYGNNITVIPAIEYTSCRIHMQFIGLEVNPFQPFNDPEPTNERLKEMIDKVHTLGGLVTVNHIPWSNSTEWGYQETTLPNHPTREELLEMGVDGFEIINGNIFDHETYTFARDHVLLMLTGTDLHHPSTTAHSWTLLRTENLTAEGIMSQLRDKKTTFMFDAAGARPVYYPPDNPSYYKLLPLLAFAGIWNSYFDDYRGMYSFQGTFCHQRRVVIHWRSYWWLVIWCLVFFGFYEIGRWGVSKLKRIGIMKFEEWLNRRRNRRISSSSEEERLLNNENDLIDMEA